MITTGNIVATMSKLTKKKELTDEQRRECDALKSLFEKRQKELRAEGKKISQYSVADFLGITQGAVNQYLNGTNPLNLAVAVKFAECLGTEVEMFSPRLAAEAKGLLKAVTRPEHLQVAESVTPYNAESSAAQKSEPGLNFAPTKVRKIPVKSLAQIINREQGSAEVSAPDTLPDRTVAYALVNDSMEGPGRKYIPRDSTLYIVEGAEPVPGKVALASLNGNEVIGEYSLFAGKPHLRPYNQQYPAVDVSEAQIAGTLAGVYWVP